MSFSIIKKLITALRIHLIVPAFPAAFQLKQKKLTKTFRTFAYHTYPIKQSREACIYRIGVRKKKPVSFPSQRKQQPGKRHGARQSSARNLRPHCRIQVNILVFHLYTLYASAASKTFAAHNKKKKVIFPKYLEKYLKQKIDTYTFYCYDNRNDFLTKNRRDQNEIQIKQ